MPNNNSAVVKDMDKFQPSPNLSRTIKLAARKVNPLNLDRTMKLATTSARVANQSVVGQLTTKFSTQAKMNPALKLALEASRTPSDSVLAMMGTKVSESSSINAVAKLAENLSIASNVGMLANMGLETSRMVHVSPIVESASTLSRVASTNSIGRMAINLSSANTSSLMKVGLKTSNEATTNPALKVDSFVNVGLAVSKTALDSQIRKVLPTIQVIAPSFTKISHRSLTKVRSPYLKVQKSITDSTIINQNLRYLEPFDKLGDLQRSVLIGFNFNQFQKTQLSTVSNGGNIELPRRPYTPKIPNEINEEDRLSLATLLGKTGWAMLDFHLDHLNLFKDLIGEVNPYYMPHITDLQKINTKIRRFNPQEPFDKDLDYKIFNMYKEFGPGVLDMLNEIKDNFDDSDLIAHISKAYTSYKEGDYSSSITPIIQALERFVFIYISPEINNLRNKNDIKAGQASRIMNDVYDCVKDYSSNENVFLLQNDLFLLYQNTLALNRIYLYTHNYELCAKYNSVVNRNLVIHFGKVVGTRDIDIFKLTLLLYSVCFFILPLLKRIDKMRKKKIN